MSINGKVHRSSPLPYWLVNLPPLDWPAQCPAFLAEAGDKNRQILSTPDSQYRRQSWSTVQEIVAKDRIDLFQRVPSDLRRYLEYTAQLKQQYGSVMDFVVKERLKWDRVVPRGKPFEYADDTKILYNDWPYGVDEKIVHLVVWTKFEFEDDLTPESRRQIDDFVRETFCKRVKAEDVIWFKSWRSLRSIHTVEHFHVMMYDPDPGFVQEITNGDAPLAAKLGLLRKV
ncbi:hypothetical protein B0A49_12382 [Cryomyces minteri]|uniref:N-acetylglucosamine-induced protein 1 n=1 Tax=Cryomyces minteri TaxID=331657 RepID=A0A4U0WKL2_9PEZI|nr:hypothetical protein B0A49_12382 [Cryomyces minteri]